MKPRKAAVIFIFITVTLDMMGIGLIAPVLPKLVLNFVGGDTHSAANWFGVFGTIFALMQFVFSPVLGGLLGNADPRLPFWVAGGLSLVNWLYGFIFVPESLPRDRRTAFTLGRANPLCSLV